MPTLAPEVVEVATGGLLAGIEVDQGATAEQISVLRVIVSHLWQRPDLAFETVPRIGPAQLAELLVEEDDRTIFHELHMALETCRHPQSAAQVAAVEEYATALDIDADDLLIFRDLIDQGVEAAAADFQRFLTADLRDRYEPGLADMPVDPDHPEIKLAEKLGTFAEYGPDTLGRAYLSFYERFGLHLPGVDVSANHHFFVSHDMTHTIAGLSTTSAAEIALSAFQFSMENNRVNRAALLASLITHEAGFAHAAHLKSADSGLLADPSAALLLGQEMRRGSKCRADFSLVNHFDLAPMRLSDVRAEFGVLAPENPGDGHHWW